MRIPFLLSFLGLAIALSSPSSGQTSPSSLEKAALAGNTSEVQQLVAAHRLGVKPVFVDLLRKWGEAKTNGQSEATFADALGTIAAEFKSQYNESSLSNAWSFRADRSVEELRTLSLADTLFLRAEGIRSSNADSAITLYHQADSLYSSIGDISAKAEVLGRLGLVNWSLDPPSFLSYNQEALALRRQVDDQQLIANTLSDLGLYHLHRDRDYSRSIKVFEESEAIRWAIRDSLIMGKMLANLGLAYERSGNYLTASKVYLRASKLYAEVGDPGSAITQRSNAAGLLTDYEGRHSEALVILLELQRELASVNDTRAEAVVLNHIGVVNRRLGRYEEAILNYQEVVRLSKENAYDELLAGALNNIGVVYLWVGRTDRAVSFLEQALEKHKSLESWDEAALSMLNLGQSYWDLGDYDKSEAILLESLDTVDPDSNPVQTATKWTALGNTQLKNKGPAAARASYEKAKVIADDLEVPDLTMGILFGLGDTEERSNNPVAALEYYNQGLKHIEESRGVLTAEEDKAGYLAQSRYLFEDVIHFLTTQAITSNDATWAETAFQFAERSKARSFLDQLAESLAGVTEGVDPDLLEEQQILTENIAYIRGELAQTDRSDRARLNEFKALMREQEAEFDRVEREMRERNPKYAELKYPDPVSLADVQSSLLSDEDLLLQYAVGDSSSTLWAISKTSFATYQLPTRTELQSQIDLVRFAIENHTQSTPTTFAAPARQLFDALIAPALESFDHASNLILIPDDVLHYLPFELLLSADVHEGATWSSLPYIINDLSMSYGQSASVLMQLAKAPKAEPNKTFLAVGNPAFSSTDPASVVRGSALAPLPFSGSEVTEIATYFEDASEDVYLLEAATESQIKASLTQNKYQYVHFATHGLVNDERPDFSALALAAEDEDNDGMLQAAEIFNLSIQSDLVVLSACETGLGQLVRGEGMVGLTRAFMYAGTPSLVVSLWSVSDESTSDLMQSFYGNLINLQENKQNALRNAKLQLISVEKTSHPFYWAPFVLVGRGK